MLLLNFLSYLNRMDIAEEWIGELEAQAEQVSQNTVQKKNEQEVCKLGES